MEKYGYAHLQDLGLTLIMPTAILNHIIDCVHHSKLLSLEDLLWKTQWDEAQQYGGHVMTLIKQFRPQLMSVTPLHLHQEATNPLTTTALNTPSIPKRHGPKTCGACGQLGHTGNVSTLCSIPQAHTSF